MAPKVVSLALAGRKLNAPPEGYGARQEQQIRTWRKTLDLNSSFEVTPEQDKIEDLKVGQQLMQIAVASMTCPCLLPALSLRTSMLSWKSYIGPWTFGRALMAPFGHYRLGPVRRKGMVLTQIDNESARNA